MSPKNYSFTITDVEPWWRTFTEALCNSRGYQTDRQRMIANSLVMKTLKRDIEAAIFAKATESI